MTVVLQMPNPSQDSPPLSQIEFERAIVIVGANGSGKSRLGAWLELNHQNAVPKPHVLRRISANRNISLGDSANRVSREQARRRVAWGADHQMSQSRVQGDPVVGTLNDFQFVVDALFAEQDAQALGFMRKAADLSTQLERPDATVLERAASVWQAVFSERRLVFEDYVVKARMANGSQIYGASQLSDGERVGFYLIAHTLLAPRDAVLLVDEPELHLHESIQSALWDSLEEARPDCRFIYITHDLGFAAARTNSPRVLLRDYQSHPQPKWIWELSPTGTGLPEDVVLRIAGSRRKTVFVEGVTGSIDHEVYSAAYPDRFIIPADGCEAVIRSVQSFNQHKGLHHTAALGIIDPDDRDAAELASLQGHGVFTLSVAQIENVLAAEPVFREVAAQLALPPGDIDNRFAVASASILALLKQERDNLVSRRALYAVQRRITNIVPGDTTQAGLAAGVAVASTSADPAGAYISAEKAVDAAVASGKYTEYLKVLRNKGVLAQMSGALSLSVAHYRRLASAALRRPDLRKQLSTELPQLP